MDTTTITAHLENLAGALQDGGWIARIKDEDGRTYLYVQNPEVVQLNDKFVCDGEVFRFEWGRAIGPVTAVTEVADRIQHVLREVEP